MPNERISMSKLKQLIGLQTSNLSVRELARALGLSIGAVSKYQRAVRAATTAQRGEPEKDCYEANYPKSVAGAAVVVMVNSIDRMIPWAGQVSNADLFGRSGICDQAARISNWIQAQRDMQILA